MNIHPVIVHFPIALLSIYSLFELIRFKQVISKSYWFYVKAIIVILGAFFVLITYITSPEREGVRIAEMHGRFALISLIIYLIIGTSYITEWLKPNGFTLFMMKPVVIVTFAVLGLVSVTITGGLGGAMIYGTDFDPFMKPVFKLLGV